MIHNVGMKPGKQRVVDGRAERKMDSLVEGKFKNTGNL